ncbi:MAG TPA: hypothetical protein VFZ61_30580, partial [Polyangiales bacterium]
MKRSRQSIRATRSPLPDVVEIGCVLCAASLMLAACGDVTTPSERSGPDQRALADDADAVRIDLKVLVVSNGESRTGTKMVIE